MTPQNSIHNYGLYRPFLISKNQRIGLEDDHIDYFYLSELEAMTLFVAGPSNRHFPSAHPMTFKHIFRYFLSDAIRRLFFYNLVFQ